MGKSFAQLAGEAAGWNKPADKDSSATIPAETAEDDVLEIIDAEYRALGIDPDADDEDLFDDDEDDFFDDDDDEGGTE